MNMPELNQPMNWYGEQRYVTAVDHARQIVGTSTEIAGATDLWLDVTIVNRLLADKSCSVCGGDR